MGKSIALFLLGISFSVCSYGQNKTPKYWLCFERLGGSWNFGRAPSVCRMTSFIEDSYVKSKFSTYVFNDNTKESAERVRYLTEMENLITKASEYYIKKRNPNVSSTELNWWRRLAVTTANQETYISHYRENTDNKLRMMRGDYGHGHGLMQIDDRWHFPAVKEGKAANLIENLFYAFDQLYNNWKKAASASCVGSSTNYYNRVRATWASYNGGLGSLCRFTKPSHPWYKNDVQFKSKLDEKAWKNYLSGALEPKKIDVACLANPNCSNNNAPPKPNNPTTPNVPNEPENPTSQPGTNHLYTVGDFIMLRKNINLRATPGGQYLLTTRSGDTYQVLDSVRVPGKKGARYYLIKSSGKFGYVYAGDSQDFSQWAVPSLTTGTEVIPRKGSVVSVQTNSGTNLRKTPGGTKLLAVPSQTRLDVTGTVFKPETKEFFIEVLYSGVKGYMYSGQTYPAFTVEDWIGLE